MKPSHQYLLGAGVKIRDMDVDVFPLPDPVQTSYALLQQFGMKRQIEQDEVMGKLKIPPFAPYFRTKENLCTIWFRKPSRISITLYNGKLFMKNSDLGIGLPDQNLLQRQYFFFALADKQYFCRIQLLQGS